MADVILAALVLVPALLTYFLRSNGAMVFLSVCAGYAASSLASNELANTLSSTNFKFRNTDIGLLLLFLPMAFSVFLTSGTASSRLRTILHTVAAAAAGALFIIAGTPFLNISLHLNLSNTKIWPILTSSQSYIAGLGAIYSLVLIWFFSKGSAKKHKK